MVGKIVTPRDAHILISGIEKRDIADKIKLRILRWVYYSELYGRAQHNRKGPYVRKAEGSEQDEEM